MAHEVIMPKFGFTQESAQIIRWIKKAGDVVEAGDPIAEVTTDKVNMDIEAPVSGILTELQYEEGDIVPVTAVIAYILSPDEATLTPSYDDKNISVPVASPQSSQKEISTTLKITPVAERMAKEAGLSLDEVKGSGPSGRITTKDVEAAIAERGAKVRAAPAARRLARELGVELEQVTGSGPRGRVQSWDVERYHEGRASMPPEKIVSDVEPVTTPPMEIVRPNIVEQAKPLIKQVLSLNGIQKTVAQRLQKSSQEIPHIHLEIQVDVSAMENLRNRVNQQRLEGARISLTAIVAKICGWALMRHPYLNAWYQSNEQGEQIMLLGTVNLGIAVALEQGLIVPVVRHIEQKGLLQVAQEIEKMVEQARQGKLRPEDVVDGSFTLSNLGMFGIERFTAIINPPQVAILTVGAVKKIVAAGEDDRMSVRPMMTLTLCADHRVVNGAVAASFLRDLKSALEEPQLMIL